MEQQPTVLIVDDEIDVINLMRDFLEMESFHVETAQNGHQALAVMERVAVDCLLLDVMMPDQTGFDLCPGGLHRPRIRSALSAGDLSTPGLYP